MILFICVCGRDLKVILLFIFWKFGLWDMRKMKDFVLNLKDIFLYLFVLFSCELVVRCLMFCVVELVFVLCFCEFEFFEYLIVYKGFGYKVLIVVFFVL